MTQALTQQAAWDFLWREFDVEENKGFPTVANIPSTGAKQFLKYFKNLETEERNHLKAALSLRATELLRGLCTKPATELQLPAPAQTASENYAKAIGQHRGWDCESLRLLKMGAGMQRAHMQGADNLYDPETLKWVDSLQASKASDLRKLIKLAFSKRFGLKPANHGGGVWLYANPQSDGGIEVQIDYGSRWGYQLQYEVTLREPDSTVSIQRASFESLLGICGGAWDFILEPEAEQKVELLCELVEYIIRLPTRMKEREKS